MWQRLLKLEGRDKEQCVMNQIEKKRKKKKHTPSVLIQFVRHHSPDSGCIAEQSQLPLGLVAGEELVEISVLHVLCDHTERVAVDAHGQQANDVGVLQT